MENDDEEYESDELDLEPDEIQHQQFISQLDSNPTEEYDLDLDFGPGNSQEYGHEEVQPILLKPRKIVHLTRQILLCGISNLHVDRNMEHYELEKAFSKITHLHLQRKQIDVLDSFHQFTSLTVLYLYDNHICEITGLEEAYSLEILDMHENRLDRINGLVNCENLVKLYLGQNRITIVEGLEQLSLLQVLHIEYQQVGPGEMLLFDPMTLDTLSKTLKILDISGNHIDTIEDLAGMESLTELVAKDNRLCELDKTTLVLTTLRVLSRLDFRGNPIAKVGKYREKMIGYTSNIAKLDGKDISPVTRTCMQRFWRMKTAHLKSVVESSYVNQDYFEGGSNVEMDVDIMNDGYGHGQYPEQEQGHEQFMNGKGNEHGDRITKSGIFQKLDPRRGGIRSAPKTAEKLHTGRMRAINSSPAISGLIHSPDKVPKSASLSLSRPSSAASSVSVRSRRSQPNSGLSGPSSAASMNAMSATALSALSSSPSGRLLRPDEFPIPQFVLATPKFLTSGSTSLDSSARSELNSPKIGSSTPPGGSFSSSRKWTSILSPIQAVETEDEDETRVRVQSGIDSDSARNKPEEPDSGPTEAGISGYLDQDQGQNEYSPEYWMQPPQFQSNVYHLPPWPHIKRLGARQPIITFIP